MVSRSLGYCAWAGLLIVGAVAGCGSSGNGPGASNDAAADSSGGREDATDSGVLGSTDAGSTDAGAKDGGPSQDASTTDSGDLAESGSPEASADSTPVDAFLGFDATVGGDVGAPDGGDSGTPGSGCIRGLGGGYVITSDGVIALDTTRPATEWFPVTIPDGHYLDHVLSAVRADVFACALRDDGTVWCWADSTSYAIDPDSYGQLGNGTTTYPPMASWFHATQVQTGPGTYLTGITSLAGDNGGSGGLTICAVDTSGKLWCWGYTVSSRPGALINTAPSYVAAQTYATTIAKSATPGDLLTNVLQVAVSVTEICVILTSGQVECWGASLYGELGSAPADGGSPADTRYPVPVVGLPSAPAPTQIVAGGYHTICALIGGEVYCWGASDHGATGTGQAPAIACAGITVDCSPPGSPVVQALSDGGIGGPLTGVTSIVAGGSWGCAIASAGALYCWGELPSGDVLGAEPPRVDGTAPPSNVTYMCNGLEFTESDEHLYFDWTQDLGVITCN
jgi:alpha-tubulin suppressor-like RCC1 family protein